MGFLGVIFTLNGVLIAGQLVSRLASWASGLASDRVLVSSTASRQLEHLLSVDRHDDAMRKALEIVFDLESMP